MHDHEDGSVALKDGTLASGLPIHFFTIVLNGEPYVRHHIAQMTKLTCRWHWHVVEGVAALRHDTAWPVAAGGKIPACHREGRSADGTSEYLDMLVKEYPENVTVYRKPPGEVWDGKREMIAAPLANIGEECLLWEIDVDELWRAEQFETSRRLFLEQPGKTAARYPCYFFVGPDLVATWGEVRGQHRQNWLRSWRFRPGMKWARHEPPVLAEPLGDDRWRDVAQVDPFTEAETAAAGLIFEHYAYATLKQLEFKEQYYGYGGAVHRWHRLQAVKAFPVPITEYFYWIMDQTVVDRADEFVPKKLIDLPAAPQVELPFSIIWLRPDGVGDGLLSSSMLPHLLAKYPGARVTVLCREYSRALYEKCPYVHEIIGIDHAQALKTAQYRESIVPRMWSLKADLCLYSTYSREGLGDFFAANSRAAEKYALAGDTCNLDAEALAGNEWIYTRLLPSPGASKPEMERNVDFLKGLGIDAPVLTPEMWTTAEDRAAAAKIFAENGFEPSKTVALFAAALYGTKAYGGFGPALAGICRERGLKIIALGSAEEEGFNRKCLDEAGVPGLNLSGKLPMRVGAELLRACRLAVGVDTGRAHIACAVGTPNVIILGGAQMGRFLPYSPLTSAVSLPLSCYGCNWKCKHERPHCVKDIAPEVLELAIREALDMPSKRPRLYLQHQGFHTLPAGTVPFFNPDMLPTMVLEVTYVAPDDVTPFALQPPSFSGNLLRVVQIPRWRVPTPKLIQVEGRTAHGGTMVSFGGGSK